MIVTEATTGSPGSAGKTDDLSGTLAGVAAYVASCRRGERAILRRLRADDAGVPPEIFWRIVERYGIPLGTDEEDRWFPIWLTILPLMVKHPHRPGARTGAVLRNAGVSPARLERWLRLDHAAALREADRFLSKADKPLDWVSLGLLLCFWSENARRRLAREFFLAPAQREQSDTSTGAE